MWRFYGRLLWNIRKESVFVKYLRYFCRCSCKHLIFNIVSYLKVSHDSARFYRAHCTEQREQFAIGHVLRQIIDYQVCAAAVVEAGQWAGTAGRHVTDSAQCVTAGHQILEHSTWRKCRRKVCILVGVFRLKRTGNVNFAGGDLPVTPLEADSEYDENFRTDLESPMKDLWNIVKRFMFNVMC